jgi:hypothetical protein
MIPGFYRMTPRRFRKEVEAGPVLLDGVEVGRIAVGDLLP